MPAETGWLARQHCVLSAIICHTLFWLMGAEAQLVLVCDVIFLSKGQDTKMRDHIDRIHGRGGGNAQVVASK